MGRHSAPSRLRAKFERTARNGLAVVFVTVVTTTTVFIGIALFAAAEDSEIPPPTITAEMRGIDEASAAERMPPVGMGHPGSPGPAANAQGEPQGELRICPATGCTASTCHAETGEPPGR